MFMSLSTFTEHLITHLFSTSQGHDTFATIQF